MSPDGRFSLRFFSVWKRNLIVTKRIWKVNFLPPLLEPLLYLSAFGLGIGALVGTVGFMGERVGYVEFIAPALVASTVMWNAFFETTYASFVRMFFQKTFDAMLATPLTLEEVISAEIAWGATKSVMAATLMLAVLAALGLCSWPSSLLIPAVAFLGGLAFAASGMFFTGIIPAIDMFSLPVFLFITPMFLFCGVFFPLDGLPGWAAVMARLFPLYHLTNLIRCLALGLYSLENWLNAAYLAAFTLAVFPLAIRAMRKRLIR